MYLITEHQTASNEASVFEESININGCFDCERCRRRERDRAAKIDAATCC